ncbi:MAG: peptidase C45 [Fluviicola sp.]|nr:peptidase C45 [Fluviicola sp.]
MSISKAFKKTGLFILKGSLIMTELIFGLLFAFILYVLLVSKINPPEVSDISIAQREKVGENHYVLGDNWLKKNEQGIWEMYIEGAPYERGLIYGELAKELVQKQEKIFVGQIDKMVPSKGWQRVLQLMIGFFNKDLPENIQLENQQEIYGISKAFSDDYNYISTKYGRILNYHAAHDIGHALNDYSMVGCTSFALKGRKSSDGKLMIGRNFDFYVGDDFAEEKIILFLKPDKGHAFVSYSWAGFTGVASGLNVKGLSVTINASKSDLPTSSKTPISLLAREILQYASTIDEAIAIARKRETFVSETILVASKIDGKAVLIEKSPTKMGIYDPGTDELICANHYQSQTFLMDQENINNIMESDSRYRYAKVKTMLAMKDSLTLQNATTILRSQKGINGDTLGMGNPRAVNQLIAHHSVVILPDAVVFYASTNDYQLGEYKGYDLQRIFETKTIHSPKSIPEDDFVNSKNYEKFKAFKKSKNNIADFLMFGKSLELTDSQVDSFINTNSESFVTYEVVGKYYLKKGQKKQAKKYFEIALTKKVASLAIEKELEELIKECEE